MFNYSKAIITININDLDIVEEVQKLTAQFGRTNRITELSRNESEVCFEILDTKDDWIPIFTQFSDKVEILVVFQTDTDLLKMTVDERFTVNFDKLREFGVLVTEDEVERVTLSVPDGRLKGFLIEEVTNG